MIEETNKKRLKVLIACEESQEVCKAFRELGHEAYSCDILDCSGGHPEWHIKGDVLEIISNGDKRILLQDGSEVDIQGWDLMIAHPPCTYLTVTGNRWFNEEKYGDKAKKRKQDREEAIEFFNKLLNADIPRIAVENPIGIISTRLRKPDQIIQPYMFGDAEEKKTCLWLKNLPLLEKTNIVKPKERIKFKSGKSMPKWYADAWKLSPKERSILRSKTFPGIAKAIAEQWGNLPCKIEDDEKYRVQNIKEVTAE